VELCPQDIVSEHLASLHKVVPATAYDLPTEDVVDGEFKEEDIIDDASTPGDEIPQEGE
jgi:hypothetical protein